MYTDRSRKKHKSEWKIIVGGKLSPFWILIHESPPEKNVLQKNYFEFAFVIAIAIQLNDMTAVKAETITSGIKLALRLIFFLGTVRAETQQEVRNRWILVWHFYNRLFVCLDFKYVAQVVCLELLLTRFLFSHGYTWCLIFHYANITCSECFKIYY